MGISYFANLDMWAALFGPLLATALFPTINRRDAEPESAEPLFSSFMDHLPGCAWIKTAADGRYVYLNRAVRELYSFKVDCLGKTDAELFGPEMAAVFCESDRRVVKTAASVEAVEPIVIKGGQRFFLVSKFPIFDEAGTVVMIAGTGMDITEHRRVEEELRESERFRHAIIESEPECIKLVKLAEQTLRESEERYRELFENAKDATYVHDLEGRYISVNRAAEKLSGYKREEILGKTFIPMVPPEQVHNLRWQLCRKLANEGETSYESEVIRKDGRRVAVEINSHLIYENGVPVGVQGTARDITQRKAAEEKLKASSEQLRALSARLQSAREEEGTRISREIHDELGSVLTSLRWDLEGAAKVLAQPVESCQIQGLRDKVESLIKLADTAITSIRRIASELRPSVLDDLGLVAAIEWQAQQFQTRTGILCHYESALENLSLDREQSTAVFRILQEALTNVLRHAQATRVRIKLNRASDHFTLSVSDNGIGMAEIGKSEQQLGILGMRERAHLIGGKVEIKPGKNQGTLVMVRVPLEGSKLAWQGTLDQLDADQASRSSVLFEE